MNTLKSRRINCSLSLGPSNSVSTARVLRPSCAEVSPEEQGAIPAQPKLKLAMAADSAVIAERAAAFSIDRKGSRARRA